MTKNITQQKVQILDQSYYITAHTEGESKSLDEAAKFLNLKLEEIKTQHQNTTAMQLLAVTALNLAYQLKECRHIRENTEQLIYERLREINEVVKKRNHAHPMQKEFGANL